VFIITYSIFSMYLFPFPTGYLLSSKRKSSCRNYKL